MTSYGAGPLNEFVYNAFNQLAVWKLPADKAMGIVYTPSGERFWTYRTDNQESMWALRGLDGVLRREYRAVGSNWAFYKDYVWRDGVPAAVFEKDWWGSELRHFHTDHLGTVRAVSGPTGNFLGYRTPFPYGRRSARIGDLEQLLFTGHERDVNTLFKTNACGTGPCNDWRDSADDDDFDYMHARYYKPILGRFMSVDPIGGNPRNPQSWNRYSYVLGNPVNYWDPWGLECVDKGGALDCGFGDVSSYLVGGGSRFTGLFGNPADDPLRWKLTGGPAASAGAGGKEPREQTPTNGREIRPCSAAERAMNAISPVILGVAAPVWRVAGLSAQLRVTSSNDIRLFVGAGAMAPRGSGFAMSGRLGGVSVGPSPDGLTVRFAANSPGFFYGLGGVFNVTSSDAGTQASFGVAPSVGPGGSVAAGWTWVLSEGSAETCR